MATKSPITTPIKPQDYAHSPVHYAVSLGDHKTLTRLTTSLPRLTDPSLIHTESDSLAQEKLADHISSVLDRRDVPHRETPLHLAVRLNNVSAVRVLASAGADVSLQNAGGWNPLQESICRRNLDISLILIRQHHKAAWAQWRRRIPRLIAVLRRMRDFYMEISFHFESSIVPFVGKIAPSDTYKIWKRDGNVRADTSLAGFDGLKIQRSDQSFLFLGDGNAGSDVVPGTLLVVNHSERKVFDAFENAGAPMTEADMEGFCAQTSVYRPGMDVTKAELVGRTNWRRQEKMESVGEWKAKVYEVQNVVFSFRSRKISPDSNEVMPLELDEDTEEGFLVAENPLPIPDRRRHSSFVREEREFISLGRKSFDAPPPLAERRRIYTAPTVAPLPPPPSKEKEYVKSLRPSIWLTEQFPLKKEELLPLLDILANKVKAVRRLRELLTTKFPPGSFPVKVAIPVVPTVKVVITFTKFVELQPTEQFFTPLSSPRHFIQVAEEQYQQQQKQSKEQEHTQNHSSSSWLRRTNSKQSRRCSPADQADPFSIPSDYKWSSIDDPTQKMMRKSKSTRKGK